MITKTSYYITDQTIPYHNLALEEALFDMVEEGECILYLWQNKHTVVIGKNQNARQECRMDLLEEEGGYLARRLSGGGAVYHDLGNINFTFLVRKADYDVEKQCRVILEAVKSFGIHAEQTGRNDLLAEGKKFSGNAFYESKDHCYHHGTIMVNVDKDIMSRYLNVSLEKMQSKGIKSVKSRVTNLSDLSPEVTIEKIKPALIDAFEKVYGVKPQPLLKDVLPAEKIERLTEKYASKEWKEGRLIPFTFELHARYEWGDVTIRPHVEEGTIQEVAVFSDGMDALFIPKVEEALTGCPFEKKEMIDAVLKIPVSDALQETMRQDIGKLIQDSF